MSFLETKGLISSASPGAEETLARKPSPWAQSLSTSTSLSPHKQPGGLFNRGAAVTEGKPRHRVGLTAGVGLVLHRPGPHGVAAGILVPRSAQKARAPQTPHPATLLCTSRGNSDQGEPDLGGTSSAFEVGTPPFGRVTEHPSP